jgi:hypothetical protein
MAANPRRESTTAQGDRIHYWQAITAQRFLTGHHLLHISERYLITLRRNLEALNVKQDWVELPDLYRFLQMNVTRSAIETTFSLSPALASCQYSSLF